METEIIYGIHPVLEALRAARRRIEEVYLAQGATSRRLEEIGLLAQSNSIAVKRIEASRLTRRTRTEQHQGAAARVGAFPLTPFSDIIGQHDLQRQNPFLIVLDSIVDPHNLGAVIRSALAVGVDGFIIPKDRAAGPTPAVSKASAGMLEHARLTRAANLAAAMKRLKRKGLWLFGLDQAAGQSLYAAELSGAIALVIGGEEKGIRPLIKKNCDALLSIPLSGRVESLNASVAAAVAMYEVYRQRNRAGDSVGRQ
jgi:23S rRNA (guanosine2251-2'-O)-methyltransferase